MGSVCSNTEKEIYGIPADMMRRLVECIRLNDKVCEIILYGSRAKGRARKYSDIDITLKGNLLTNADLLEIEERIDDLCLPYEVDLSLWSHLEYKPLLEEIVRYGRPL